MRASSWMVPGYAPQAEYILDVDSATHVTQDTSPVKFTVQVNSIPSTDQTYLQLDPGCQVGLEAFIMPNNIETFPVIDTESNYSAGFFSMQLVYDDDTIHDYAVNYMKPGIYSRTEALEAINSGLRDNLLETNDKSGNVNVCGEVFTLNCFYASVDPVSHFISLETFLLNAKNPFVEVYAKTAKEGTPKNVVRVDIWFSTELKNFLGVFSPTGPLHWVGDQSHVSKHGFQLDTLVAEMSTLAAGEHFLKTSVGNYPNRPCMLIVKSDLVGVGEYGTLGVCSIPGDNSTPIQLVQDSIKWMPATKLGRLFQFNIAIENDRDQLLPFRGGSVLVVIRIRNAALI